MKARTIFCGIALFFLSFAIAVPAKAQTTTAEFQRAVAAYQQAVAAYEQSLTEETGKKVDEAAIKVIKMAATMRPLPPIPEEARRHYVRGAAMFKDAQSTNASYMPVVGEFGQAVRLAPWWPEARYNLVLASEAAGLYTLAIKNLKLYLLFKLPAADARAAQDKIYALELKQEKADKAKAVSDAAAAAAERERAQAAAAEQQRVQQQKKFDDLIRTMNGRRYYEGKQHYSHVQAFFYIDVRGKVFVNGNVFPPYTFAGKFYKELDGFDSQQANPLPITGWKTINADGNEWVISEDGGTITKHDPTGYRKDDIFYWPPKPGTAPD